MIHFVELGFALLLVIAVSALACVAWLTGYSSLVYVGLAVIAVLAFIGVALCDIRSDRQADENYYARLEALRRQQMESFAVDYGLAPTPEEKAKVRDAALKYIDDLHIEIRLLPEVQLFRRRLLWGD